MSFVVHAPPRTGGFSCRSFLADDHGFKCYHAHYLHNQHYYQDKRKLRDLINSNGFTNYKVVCTIRDPIARNLSEYWRRWFIDRPNLDKSTAMREKQGLRHRPGSHEEKFYAFVDHYRQHQFLGSEPYFWGIDVFDGKWRPPYTIWDNRFLLIRCEDLNEYGEEALSKLAGKELYGGFPTKNVVPTDRQYIPLTEAYVTAMLQDQFFPRQFYSEVEMKEMQDKWMTQTQPQ